MKQVQHITLLFATIGIVGNAAAQDDFYPSSTPNNKQQSVSTPSSNITEDDYATATDYYVDSRAKEREQAYNERLGITDSTTYYEDENGNIQITNNYYQGNNYDFDNEYYDYEYASRIRRFRRGAVNYGYYDDYYTNYYWYDQNPYNYGTSIYTSYNWWTPRYSAIHIGWPYFGGWSIGWRWGYGYNYCGINHNYGYHGIYGHHVSSYYQNGFGGYGNQNIYASTHYYNSYDRNSYYYGKRGRSSSYAGYGNSGRRTSSNQSFGAKYEKALKTRSARSTENNTVRSTRTNTATRGGGQTRPTTNVRSATTRRPVKVYSNPSTTTRTPRNSTHQRTSTSPRTTRASTPSNRPKTTTRTPRTTTRPTTRTRSSYNNASKTRGTSRKPSYTRPKSTTRPSYSKPSGSYNRGRSTSRPSSSPRGRSTTTKSSTQRRR